MKPENTVRASRIAVIGSYVTDCCVDTDNLPSWGSYVHADLIRSTPGGKAANQAVALARMGAQASAVSVVGKDPVGADLLAKLQANGVDTDYIQIKENVDTPTCLVFRGPDQKTAIVWRISPEAEVSPLTIQLAKGVIRDADAIVATFEVPPRSMREILNMAKKHGKKVFINAAPERAFSEIAELPLGNAEVLVARESEARALLGEEGSRARRGNLAALIAARYKTPLVCVTLGEQGSSYWDGTGTYAHPAFPALVKDPIGAGDAFTAALVTRMVNGDDIHAAIKYATAAAAVSVGTFGALPSMPTSRACQPANR